MGVLGYGTGGLKEGETVGEMEKHLSGGGARRASLRCDKEFARVKLWECVDG